MSVRMNTQARCRLSIRWDIIQPEKVMKPMHVPHGTTPKIRAVQEAGRKRPHATDSRVCAVSGTGTSRGQCRLAVVRGGATGISASNLGRGGRGGAASPWRRPVAPRSPYNVRLKLSLGRGEGAPGDWR